MRILAYLHVSFAGIFAFSHARDGRRERGNPADGAARRGRRSPMPIATSSSASRCGSAPAPRAARAPCRSTSRCRSPTRSACRVMAHIDDPPPSYEEVIARLRPGDVLTHAFRPFPEFAGDRAGHGEARRARGARARRAVRHRPRQGLVRVQDRARHARQRLLAGHHLVRRAHALHQRPGLRPGHHHVEVPLPRHAAWPT